VASKYTYAKMRFRHRSRKGAHDSSPHVAYPPVGWGGDNPIPTPLNNRHSAPRLMGEFPLPQIFSLEKGWLKKRIRRFCE